MIDILEILKAVILGAFLLTEGIRDLIKRKISIIFVVVYGLIGLLLQIFIIKESWPVIVGGILVGIVFLLLAKITNERIGYGDGWILLVAGIYLGFRGTLFLLSLSLFIASLLSVLLLLLKKVGRKTELPFVSFMVPGYLLMLVIMR